eukprot:UN2783
MVRRLAEQPPVVPDGDGQREDRTPVPAGAAPPLPAVKAGDQQESAATASGRLNWTSVSGAVFIPERTAAQAFPIYAHLPNHPKWSLWLMKVAEDDLAATSEWSIRALTFTFKWTAKITKKRPPSLISWESTSGIPNRGRATFTDVPGENPGCRVQLEVSFQAPSP